PGGRDGGHWLSPRACYLGGIELRELCLPFSCRNEASAGRLRLVVPADGGLLVKTDARDAGRRTGRVMTSPFLQYVLDAEAQVCLSERSPRSHLCRAGCQGGNRLRSSDIAALPVLPRGAPRRGCTNRRARLSAADAGVYLRDHALRHQPDP